MAYEGDTITAANPTIQHGAVWYRAAAVDLARRGHARRGRTRSWCHIGRGRVAASVRVPNGDQQPGAVAAECRAVRWLIEGQPFAGHGAQALQMAQNGVLTPQQQAQLSLYQRRTGERDNADICQHGPQP